MDLRTNSTHFAEIGGHIPQEWDVQGGYKV
jgi:hypothetical protein